MAAAVVSGNVPKHSLSSSSSNSAAPVIGMSKTDIVKRGLELGAPFQLTWSCYQSEKIACGACESCALRLRAFARAGAADPLRYADPGSRPA